VTESKFSGLGCEGGITKGNKKILGNGYANYFDFIMVSEIYIKVKFYQIV
jgi:hypothetical protein